jgi:hypothetical protein
VIFHQELNNDDGNLEDKYCSQIKASCHINGHVTVTAIKYGEQNNHVKISRTCMMPQDQMPGVDICMSEWQDIVCTQQLEEKNLIQVACAGTGVKNVNEIVFEQDGAPPHFSKDLTFSESHIT